MGKILLKKRRRCESSPLVFFLIRVNYQPLNGEENTGRSVLIGSLRPRKRRESAEEKSDRLVPGCSSTVEAEP